MLPKSGRLAGLWSLTLCSVTDEFASIMHTLTIRPSAPDRRPQQSSLFLKLPTELLVIIYEMAAQHSIDNAVNIWVNEDPPLFLMRNTGGFALLHTCHIIRNESLDIVKSLFHLTADRLRAESTRLHAEGATSYYTPTANYGD